MATSPLARGYAAQKPSLGAVLDPSHPLARGLVGCWLLNEGAGGKALDCARGNTGTLSATPPKWAAGATGVALDFSQSTADSVACASGSPVTTGQITVVAWVKPAALTRGDLVTCWTNGTAGSQFNLLYGITSGRAQFFISNGSSSANSSAALAAMTAGARAQVGGTYDGSSVRVYLNGVASQVAASSLTLNTSSLTALRLGDNANGDGNFSGAMESAMVWNRALSFAEMAALYAAPYQMFLAGAPRYYSFASGRFRRIGLGGGIPALTGGLNG